MHSQAYIRLSDDAPLSDPALKASMHKTYTDAFKTQGFTGGQWAYAINTNESSGVPCSVATDELVSEGRKRLGIYYLGWESIEVRHQLALSGVVLKKNASFIYLLRHPAPSGWNADSGIH